VWVDDPHFELGYHLRHTALPTPGGAAALHTLMGRLMSQELDRNRPLWETWMVEGLEDDRWALISKVHHCMVDGVAGTDLMSVVLDTERDAGTVDVGPWDPAPEPSDVTLATTAVTELLRSPYEQYRALRSGTRAPRDLGRRLGDVVAGLRAYGRELRPPPASSLEGPIGPHRRWEPARTTLDEIRTVRHALGGTVNDVVLTAISHGFAELVRSRGEDPTTVELRSLIPVSLRAPDARGVLDNRVTALVLHLPIGVDDPVERLDEVRRRMEELKTSHEADAGGAIVGVADITPAALVGPAMRLATRAMHRTPQWLINTVTTNVPGPQEPLYLAGREMLEYLPFVPIGPGIRTGVAILSYNGRIAFGVTGDWDAAPDIDVLARGIEAGMATLLERAGAAATTSDPAVSS
jgi:diacylglycerol O-acyltransferase / wax synthase